VASTYSIIGQPVAARVDGTGKVTGVTRYADDLFLPRMLYGKLLRSPHPHAHILSIDISKAAALANAVYDALGVRIDAIPITPEKVLKALELRARGQEPRVGPQRYSSRLFPAPT